MEHATRSKAIRSAVAVFLAVALAAGLTPLYVGIACADGSASAVAAEQGGAGETGVQDAQDDQSVDALSADGQDGSQVNLKENSWRYEDGMLVVGGSDSSGGFEGGIAALAEGDEGSADSEVDGAPGLDPWSLTDDGFVNSQGNVIEDALRKGIDVSEHQGWIDWARVAESDVSFVIIRCGYGSDYASQDDDYWLYNVTQCEKYGIPYGVYLYSYAQNVAMAQSEAEHVLRLLEGHTPSYPVYIDFEENTVLNVLREFEVDIPTRMAEMAEVFCSAIEEAGYTAGVYANLNWWNNYLTDGSFDQWDRWVAQYNIRCDYAGDYHLWQCTSSGSVDGIDGRVDVNFVMSYPLDVDEGDWYVISGALRYVLARDLMSGYGNGDYFGPYDSITRGQVATILWRMAGEPDVSSAAFDDVNYDEYYGGAIAWARATGVVSGYTGTNSFGPDVAVTRQELACMLANYAREIGGVDTSSTCAKLDAMPDSADVADWARESVGWALDRGLINGSLEGDVYYVRPDGNAWRASMASMIMVLHRDVL